MTASMAARAAITVRILSVIIIGWTGAVGVQDKLKPCPFCGGEAEVVFGACDYNVYQVCCTGANCQAMAGWSNTEEEAIEEWNRRAGNEAD